MKQIAPFPLVIDNGSYEIKIGMSNDEHPRIYKNFLFHQEEEQQQEPPIPAGATSQNGAPNPSDFSQQQQNQIKIQHGNDIPSLKSTSHLNYHFPYNEDYHLDATLQAKIWNFVFEQEKLYTPALDLITTTKSHNVHSTRENHAKMSEFIFELFEFDSWTTLSEAYSALLGYTKLNHSTSSIPLQTFRTACIVDCGYRSCRITPVVQQQVQHHAVHELSLGGRLITQQFQNLLSKRHFDFSTEWWIANCIKEKSLYVSMDYFRELKSAQLRNSRHQLLQTYLLPTGESDTSAETKKLLHDTQYGMVGFMKDPTDLDAVLPTDCVPLHLTDERIIVPEMLFRPNTRLECRKNFESSIEQEGLNSNGNDTSAQQQATQKASLSHGMQQKNAITLPQAILESICNSGFSIQDQKLLLQNIILSGGSSQLYNLSQRLEKELHSFSLPQVEYARVFSPHSKHLLSWHGGSLFSSFGVSDEIKISKQMYFEMGDSVVHRRGTILF